MKSHVTAARRKRAEHRPHAGRRALRELMRPLALPADASRGEPRITIYADARAFIENHSGIIEFDSEHVRIAAHRLTITLRGGGLVLDCCEGRALVVAGRLLGVELETRGGGA